MKVLPRLNMNKHPEKVTNGALVDAKNIMVSKDNFMLQTEPIPMITDIYMKLKSIANTNYKIIYILPCNKELVLFVNDNEVNKLTLYRYNETLNDIIKCTKIEYNNGELIGTFTYNNNELIIAFSEYFENNSKNIPLRTINLGEFKTINENDLKQLNNTDLHSICPVVKIPTITTSSQNGYANKGWYYIFIRYKISNDTYTQWFNTNETFFNNDSKQQRLMYNLITATIPISTENGTNYEETTTDKNRANEISAYTNISTNKNIVSKTFKCEISNLDNNYSYYQLGFININKSESKCYKTNDISINDNSYTFNNTTINTYSINEIIKTYYNYYNIKSLINNNNKLCIANYNENDDITDIIKQCSNIELTIKTTINTYTTNYLSSNYNSQVHVFPNQPYNFFIHFVDKYGKIYNGVNINNFNVNYDGKTILNKLNNLIIITPEFNTIGTKNSLSLIETYSLIINQCNITFKLNKLPTNVIGYFISYEKLEKSIKYTGITAEGNKIYSDKFNFDDKIDLNFDTIRIYPTNKSNLSYFDKNVFDIVTPLNNWYFKTESTYIDYSYNKVSIIVADAANNILQSTACLVLNDILGDNDTFPKDNAICELINTNFVDFYCSDQKELIPCSNVSYEINKEINIKTNGCFVSLHHAITFNKAYYDNTNKYYKKDKYIGATLKPFYVCEWFDYDDLPWNSLEYNNNPVVQFYPLYGLSTTDEHKKSFVAGTIIECKNTIDLFQQKNTTIYDNYPKSLNWYNPAVINQTKFPKTIRRSNIYQDESHTNAWRQFEQEQYKNISENKGDIIKLITIGYYFIAHTQHSMFLFNSTDTLQSEEGKIQLANADIWDINYKEVLTSTLGYAGLQKEWSGIIGSFGYIFYDKDSCRLYQYDNQQIKFIDQDITNFISKLKDYDAHFVEDKKNNRILITFIKEGKTDITLSYNYGTNTFVSRHDYKYYRGYNTKENIYLINKDQQKIQNFESRTYNNSTIDIIINTNYETMKYIDFISYKIREIKRDYDNYSYSPVEEFNTYYAGDKLRVYSDICDTGLLDITYDEPEKIINKVTDYNKPYWRLGNWHFNALRNKIVDYTNNQISKSGASRIYGNYFITHFEFNVNAPVEIESINGKLLNATIQ